MRASDRVGFSESLRMLLDKRAKDPEVVTRWIWSHVNQAFSRPVAREDSALDYLPPRSSRSSSVTRDRSDRYKSGLGPGGNLALFKLSDARVVGRPFTLQVTSVEYEFRCEGDITGQWPYD